MDDLLRWLGEQLDEDERIARAADADLSNLTGCVEIEYPEIKADEKHALRHSPARVLREIDAKRQLLARYERAMENRRAHPDDLASAGALLALHGVVKLIALPYEDRPGFREEWRP